MTVCRDLTLAGN